MRNPKKLLVSTLALAAFSTTLLAFYLPQSSGTSWSPGPDLARPRDGAAAAYLLDGRALVCGGADASGVTASAELLQAGAFAETASLATARRDHALVVLHDGRALAVGGTAADGAALASAEIFDPFAGSWAPAGTLAHARSGAQALLLLDGRVLVAGGERDGAPVAELELFDPVTGAFTTSPVAPSPARTEFAAALLPDGRVLLAGGSALGSALASTLIFDAEAGSLFAGPNLATPRAGASATRLQDGSVLVAGGSDGSAELASCERFDSVSNVFLPVAESLATARRGHGAVLLPGNGSVLLFGGSSAGADLDSSERYLPWSGDLVAAGSIGAPRRGAADCAEAGRLLVLGGEGLATSMAFAFPSVTTDRFEYLPSETAHIAGAGFLPLETVTLQVTHMTGGCGCGEGHDPFSVTADAAGRIATTWFVDPDDSLGALFRMTADGADGRHAETVFADSPKVGSVDVGPQTPPSIAPGASATYLVTVNRGTGPGSNGSFTANMSITSALPAGVGATFVPAIVSFSPTQDSRTTTLTLTTTGATPPGSASFTVQASTSANDFATGTGTLSVQGSQTITFPPVADRVYGAAPFTLTATASSGLPVTFSLDSGPVSLADDLVTITGAGSVTVRASQAGNASYAPAPDVVRTFAITRAPLSATPANASREYGEPNPGFTGSLVGVQYADDITASYASVATAASAVGTYPITATLNDPDGKLGNYDVTLNEGTLTITVAPLSVTPANASREYGEPNPAFGGSIVGIKNGDDITATYASVATAASSVGTYPITATLDDPDNKLGNYDVTLNEGTLAITVAPLSVTPANASREYGEPNPGFGGSIVGIKNGDDITATYASVATAASSVGTYPITANLNDPDGKLGNYDVTLNEGTLTITVAPLSVTPANASREYGEPNPAFGGSIVGIKNGDDITATYASVATAASSVGTYPITANLNDPDGKLGNYDVTLNEGTLTITVAPLSVTPANASRGYGAGNPPFSGSTVGLKNGDPITASYSCAANSFSPIGTYPITATLNDPSSKLGNYLVTLNTGTLTIGAATLTVQADDKTKVLGSANPVFTGTITGILNGDDITATYASPATASSPVGSYPIVPTLVDPDGKLSNYTVTVVNGTLSIRYAPAGTTCSGIASHQILQPINPNGTSVFKQKSSVPAKFRVCDAAGNSVALPNVVASFNLVQIVQGTVSQDVNEPVDSTNTSSSFHFDPSDQQWIFVINTRNLNANSTYTYRIGLNDGSEILFTFGLK